MFHKPSNLLGENGVLSYRINLDGFPGRGWAFSYFAEIEDLVPSESRKFKLVRPDVPNYENLIVNRMLNLATDYMSQGFPMYHFPLLCHLNLSKQKTHLEVQF